MKRVVIGTAGHVDHGKTSLIKALTGVDCDRLKEEKERGLTIELGFTSLRLPSGQEMGVVDVPGHVRFIRHMLSGASGIDLVLLVVAADEGVMPQTAEHVQICELLGIQRGVVALTKVDIVDDDLLALATDDVREFLGTTFLKDAPIVPVSAVKGTGLEELVATIEGQIHTLKERQTTGVPVLPVDRVFTMKGFGTVVTGTLARGVFNEGDDVEILPAGRRAKIRVLHVHSQEVHQSMAGMRTAVNLQGMTIDEVDRGSWIVPADTLRPTRLIDARLSLIKRPGKGGIKLYIGTSEVMGEMSLHAVDGMDVARIRLKAPIVACHGDRFIVRSVSPAHTIGGGFVLNPAPMRRFSEPVIQGLLAQERTLHLKALISDAGMQGLSRRDLVARFSDPEARIDKCLHELLSKGEIVRFDTTNDQYVSVTMVQRLRGLILDTVSAFHTHNQLAPAISREHLRSSLGISLDVRLFHKVIVDLIKAGEIEEVGSGIRRTGFCASLADDLGDVSERLYRLLDQSGLEPPKVAELAERLATPPKDLAKVIGFMSREGKLLKIKEDLFLTEGNECELKRRVGDYLTLNQSMSPTDMKAVMGLSRKYAIPYMEYLDRIKFTMRVGNVRKLVSKKQ